MKAFFARKHTISHAFALQIIVCFCCLVTMVSLALQPAEAYILIYLAHLSYFIMPLLNFLPIFGICLLLFLLTQRLALSMGIAGYTALLMAVINRVKLILRGDPLLHWDLTMVDEVFGITGQLDPRILPCFVLSLLILFIFIALGDKKMRVTPWPRKRRTLNALLCAAVLFTVNGTVYRSASLYKWLTVHGSFYNLSDIHNSKGNLYTFLYNFNVYKTRQPDAYDPSSVLAAVNAYAEDEEAVLAEAVRPHIIMVMGEAFSDLSEQDIFHFSGGVDPLQAFKALGKDGISGHIIPPSRGGGTADTEFDVLTGRPSRYFRSTPYAYRLITRQTEALPSLLARAGYASFALHPGHNWFYNRQNAYPCLGFNFSVFDDAFGPEAYMKDYISEAATFDMLLSLIEAHLQEKPNVPLFSFCVTIQNHVSYLDRYLAPGTFLFDSSVPMTYEEKNILSNYFAGVVDADTELKRLAEYLDTLDEPFILVYFGDHLPALSAELYDKLIPGADAPDGSFLQETRLYRTPFLLWENQCARESLGALSRAKPLPESSTISSNYLGAYLLELLGLDGLSPYFTYANALREKFPILLETLSFAPDLTEAADMPAEDRAMLKLFQDWVYYRIKNE